MNVKQQLLVLLLLLTSMDMAQEIPKVHFVRATGEATVTARPDRAQISIGVMTQSSTAQAAASANATQTTQVIDAIKRTLGQGGELKTEGYSISPQYQYDGRDNHEDGEPTEKHGCCELFTRPLDGGRRLRQLTPRRPK